MLNNQLVIATLRTTESPTGKPYDDSDPSMQTYFKEFDDSIRKHGAKPLTVDPKDLTVVNDSVYFTKQLLEQGKEKAPDLTKLIDAVIISNIDLFPELKSIVAFMKVFEHHGIPLTYETQGLDTILENKRVQENYLRTHGVPVPDTLYTVNKNTITPELLSTVFSPNDTIIIKQANGAFGQAVEKADGITDALEKIKSYPEDTRFLGFQKAVEESMGISTRVTTIGRDIKDICQFKTQLADEFRSCIDPEKTSVLPVKDEKILEKLKRLTNNILDLFPNMNLLGIDFLVDNKGNPWVLEVNDSPYMFPYEKGTEVFDHFIDHTIQLAKKFRHV
jgi:glutathione synthase/RimK-type ligase-like ATP-grasp enzyme